MPLMYAQLRHELSLYPKAWQPMPPPREGNYLVRAEIRDDDTTLKSVRLDYFDGEKWPRMGGYTQYTAWMNTPPV
jgi:hypothetical protein